MAEKESPALTKDEKQLEKERKEQEKQQREKEKREKRLEKERKKQEEKERKRREKEAKAQQKAQSGAGWSADRKSEQPKRDREAREKEGGASSSAEGNPGPAEEPGREEEAGGKEETQGDASSNAEGNPGPAEEPGREEEAGGKEETHSDASSNAEQTPEEPKEEHIVPPQPPNEAESTVTSTPQSQAPVVSDEAASEPPSTPISRPEAVTVAEPPGQITGCGQPIGIVFDATNAGEGALTASCTGAKVGTVMTAVTELREGKFNVQFTPIVADVYMLSVRWGGIEIEGSPFSINLSCLSPAPAPQDLSSSAQQLEEGRRGSETEATKEREEVEEEEEESYVSDDPFDMALQASKLLEEQQRQAQRSASHLQPTSTTTTGNTPSPQPNPAPVHSQHLEPPPSHSPNLPLHQPMASKSPQPSPSTSVGQQGTSSLPYPVDDSLSSMPYPVSFPAREEDVRYLREVNMSLQHTNEELGGEVADLKKKMGEFEVKLSAIEQNSQLAEEEKKELMAHINIRGWLYKRGIKGPTASVWRQRFFRCDQGSKIYYYKSAEEAMPRGYIDLEKVESVEEVSEPQPDTNNRVGFLVNCGERTFQMEADDDDTRKRWISAIKYLKNWHQKNKSALSPPNVSL